MDYRKMEARRSIQSCLRKQYLLLFQTNQLARDKYSRSLK
jgi:hypothetical protein